MPKETIKKFVGDIVDRGERHRERNSPTGFDFAIADSVTMLHPEHWDYATKGQTVFMERAYLRLLEKHGPAELECRYALIFRDALPVAAVAAQITDLGADQLVPAGTDEDPSAIDVVKDAVLGEFRERVLVCGNLLAAATNGVAFAPGEDPAEIWPGVAEALYRIRRAEKLRGTPDYVVIKDIAEHQAKDAEVLSRFSYRPIDTGPDMVLDIRPEWKSYDDYLASLNGRYRRKIRKIAKEVAASCEVVAIEDVAAVQDDLHRLYMNVVDRAGVRPMSLTPAYLGAMAETLGNRFLCTTIRRDGELVAFVTTIFDGDKAIGYYLGLDYEANAELPLYFRLLQTVIEDGMARGCRRISMGRTALEPKARLGCEPVQMSVWVRHRVSAINVVLRELFTLVPHEEPPERNPFRD